MKFTEDQIAFILSQKSVSRRGFDEIAMLLNENFDLSKKVTGIDVKQCWEKYKNSPDLLTHGIKTLKDVARIKKTNSFTSKENRTILQLWNDRDDILDAIKSAAKDINKIKIKPVKTVKKN